MSLFNFQSDQSKENAIFLIVCGTTLSVIAICVAAYHVVKVLYPNGIG